MGFELPSRVLIVGLGCSGQAAARLAAAGGAEVWVTDQALADQLGPALAELPAARTFLGGHPAACLEGVGLVVTSPGVAPIAPILAAARSRSIPVLSEVEFAWRHRPEAPLVAITGSNGKSTVTVLVAEMLSADGIAAVAGGNLGTPASQLVTQGGWQTWVLEISSFQSELFESLRPRVGVFLNLSQDHLERHPDLAIYRQAKQRLFTFQESTDTAVLSADDPAVAATPTRARRRLFSVTGAGDGRLDRDQLIIDDEAVILASDVALAGRHNLANALAAALAARALGASTAAISGTLTGFTGLPHRHRTVHTADGVRWVDDSKATNVGATLAGLSGYSERAVHLILGGLSKGQDFTPLLDEVRRSAARVYIIGADGPQIATIMEPVAAIEHCGTVAEAVRRARLLAEPGQTVLLAPACASFDQFSGYPERGDVFTALVRSS